MKIKLDVSDPATRELWDAAKRAKAEVSRWPAWKRGARMSAPTVICTEHARNGERCTRPEPLHCYGAYTGTGCGSEVHYRPGRGPKYREIFCPKCGRQPWPPEHRNTCASSEVFEAGPS